MAPARAAQPALTAALLLATVRGFTTFRPLRQHSIVQRLRQRTSIGVKTARPRTVVASGAIGLAANATKGLVEGVVRTATGNEEYEFGDLTKGVVRDLTGKDASEYKFGDITKRAVTNFTGKEDYEFGDISRKVLADAESSLEALRDEYFRDLPNELQKLILGNLPKEQREALISAITSYGSMAVLVWSLVSTTCTAGLGLRPGRVRACARRPTGGRARSLRSRRSACSSPHCSRSKPSCSCSVSIGTSGRPSPSSDGSRSGGTRSSSPSSRSSSRGRRLWRSRRARVCLGLELFSNHSCLFYRSRCDGAVAKPGGICRLLTPTSRSSVPPR